MVLLVAGFALIALAFGDALATTLTVSVAAGPLTRRLSAALWALLLRLRRGSGGSPLLRLAGAVLLVNAVLVWVMLLWGG